MVGGVVKDALLTKKPLFVNQEVPQRRYAGYGGYRAGYGGHGTYGGYGGYYRGGYPSTYCGYLRYG